MRRAISARQARKIIEEKQRRSKLDFMTGLLPQQRDFIDDPRLFKALFGTRRMGKSWVIGVYLFKTALEHAGCTCLYLGLTRWSAISVMNKDIMERLNREFQINAKWNDTKNEWQLANGSIIRFRGADANESVVNMLVGQKYKLAILDEASKYRHDLDKLIYGALLPAMGDDIGTTVLAGTPSNITSGLFYDITTGKKKWSVHSWTWRENVAVDRDGKRMCDKIAVVHDKTVEDDPLIIETPLYQQEWCGKWVVDTSYSVYRFDYARNSIDALPHPANEYSYILGVDTGFKDADAFVVVAYHSSDPNLYVVYAHKQRGLVLTGDPDNEQEDPGMLSYVRALDARQSFQLRNLPKFNFIRYIIDAPLKSTEEIVQRHRIPFESAEKFGGALQNKSKKGVVDVFNGDLITGRIKLLPAAQCIYEEWDSLIWDERKRAIHRWIEDDRCDNHYSDALLYAWRAARNYNFTETSNNQNRDMNSEAYADEHFERVWSAQRKTTNSDGWMDEMLNGKSLDPEGF